MNGSPPFLTSRTQNNIADRVRWKNLAAEAVPSYGVVGLDDYDDATNNEHQISKPSERHELFYVNGPVAIAINKRGSSLLWSTPLAVLVNSAETISVGDMVGPVSGQWYMGRTGFGFRVFSPPNADDIAVVERVPSEAKTVVLDGNLTGTTSAPDTPSTATASILQRNGSGDLEDTGLNLTVVHRGGSPDFLAGTLGEAKRVDGDVRFYPLSCAEMSSTELALL